MDLKELLNKYSNDVNNDSVEKTNCDWKKIRHYRYSDCIHDFHDAKCKCYEKGCDCCCGDEDSCCNKCCGDDEDSCCEKCCGFCCQESCEKCSDCCGKCGDGFIFVCCNFCGLPICGD